MAEVQEADADETDGVAKTKMELSSIEECKC